MRQWHDSDRNLRTNIVDKHLRSVFAHRTHVLRTQKGMLIVAIAKVDVPMRGSALQPLVDFMTVSLIGFGSITNSIDSYVDVCVLSGRTDRNTHKYIVVMFTPQPVEHGTFLQGRHSVARPPLLEPFRFGQWKRRPGYVMMHVNTAT